MEKMTRIAIVLVTVACLPATAAVDVRERLQPSDVRDVRIHLNPWGAHLGFELELAGDDPRVETLAALIRAAEPGGGHRCANAGAIRFRMEDGRRVGVGLLPSHQPGVYELRLYDGDVYVAAYRVDRASLLTALESIGVPVDDPAFRE